MSRFIRVQRKRLACLSIAEFAATGADVTTYHEGGGSFSPAFSHVWATSAAANGVQAVGVNDTFGFGVPFIGSYTDFKPFRLAYSVCHFNSFSKKFVSFVYRRSEERRVGKEC